MASYSQTKGDHYNTNCPHCGKNNSYVTQGVAVICGEVKRFQKSCFYCRQTIFYHASHEIMVTAYAVDPLPNSEGVQRLPSCPNCNAPDYNGLACLHCGSNPKIGQTKAN